MESLLQRTMVVHFFVCNELKCENNELRRFVYAQSIKLRFSIETKKSIIMTYPSPNSSNILAAILEFVPKWVLYTRKTSAVRISLSDVSNI